MSITAIIHNAKIRVTNHLSDASKSKDTEYSGSLTTAAKILDSYIACAEDGNPDCIIKLCGIMGVEVPIKDVEVPRKGINVNKFVSDSVEKSKAAGESKENIVDTNDSDHLRNESGDEDRNEI